MATTMGYPCLPLADKVEDHLGWVLQVRKENNDGVAVRLEDRVMRRANVAEVARIEDYLNVRISSGNAAQNLDGSIVRIIVDDDMFVAVLRETGEELAHTVCQNFDVTLFVVTGTDNADQLHNPVPSPTCHSAVRRIASCKLTV